MRLICLEYKLAINVNAMQNTKIFQQVTCPMTFMIIPEQESKKNNFTTRSFTDGKYNT